MKTETYLIDITTQSEQDSSIYAYEHVAESKSAAEAASLVRMMKHAPQLLDACKAALAVLSDKDDPYQQIITAIAQAEGDTPHKLALKFSELLRKALNAKDMALVILKNRDEVEPNVCHSHDFIDSNMVMAEAFKLVLGREINLQSDSDCGIWNAAWAEAKASEFKAA